MRRLEGFVVAIRCERNEMEVLWNGGGFRAGVSRRRIERLDMICGKGWSR